MAAPIVRDALGRRIFMNSTVIWTDPETQEQTRFVVYDTPREDMVRLWNGTSEVEAYPEECEVIG